jgi:CRP-like cAMP-binding protein
MDHSLCAMDNAEIALLPHTQLQRLIQRRPTINSALWRITLIDSAIFRQAVTNNGARPHVARLAHFMCEHYTRAKDAELAHGRSCSLRDDTRLRQA